MKNHEEVAKDVFAKIFMYEQRTAHRKKIFHRITSTLSIIAISFCMIMTLSVGYAFAAGFGLITDFLGFFEKQSGTLLSENQQLYLEDSIAEIGKSVTREGVTVTMNAALTDGSIYYIYLDIEAPEDISLNKLNGHGLGFTRTLSSKNPNRHDISFASRGCIPIEDFDGKNNTISMLLRTNVGVPSDSLFSFTDGYERTLTLENLFAYSDEYPYEQYIIATGPWCFNFFFTSDVQGTEGSVELLESPLDCCGKTNSGEYASISINSICMKNLGITFDYDFAQGIQEEAIDLGVVKIVMKDGSIINTIPSGAVIGKSSFVFSAPVIINDVECITINDDVVVYVNPNESDCP